MKEEEKWEIGNSLQPLGLYPANSIFIGNFLTTEGQESTADHQMLQDLGFEIDFVQEEAGIGTI